MEKHFPISCDAFLCTVAWEYKENNTWLSQANLPLQTVMLNAVCEETSSVTVFLN